MGEDETEKVHAVEALEASHRVTGDDNRQKLMNDYLLAHLLSGKRIFYRDRG